MAASRCMSSCVASHCGEVLPPFFLRVSINPLSWREGSAIMSASFCAAGAIRQSWCWRPAFFTVCLAAIRRSGLWVRSGRIRRWCCPAILPIRPSSVSLPAGKCSLREKGGSSGCIFPVFCARRRLPSCFAVLDCFSCPKLGSIFHSINLQAGS